MTLQAAILLDLKTSIVLTVFTLGLGAAMADITFLLHQPGKLLRSLAAIDVAMPAFALTAVTLFPLHPAVEIALVALSVSPVPPLFPSRAQKSGGKRNYVIALLITAAIAAIVFVPLGLRLSGLLLGVDIRIPVSTVLTILGMTVIVPLLAGVAVRTTLPALADRIAKPLAIVAAVLLVTGSLPVVFAAGKPMLSLIGNGTILIFVAFVVFGLAVGHALGGPEPSDRTALAFATASRHPAMALAIATANFPEQKLAAPAIVLYLLVSIVMGIPYTIWRRRAHAALS